jgi:hypothetical protein
MILAARGDVAPSNRSAALPRFLIFSETTASEFL